MCETQLIWGCIVPFILMIVFALVCYPIVPIVILIAIIAIARGAGIRDKEEEEKKDDTIH